MAIEEIPIDTGAPEVEEEAEPIEQSPEPEETLSPEPVPKRRGRPPGAKNRAKAKPSPQPVIKRTRSRRPPTPETTDESSEEEPPPRRVRRQVVQEDPNPMRTMAAEMLQLMQHQTMNRQAARANKYASWFPQQTYG